MTTLAMIKKLGNFSKSLTDEIIMGLSKHPDLRVITRESASESEKTENTGIRYTLEGAVKWDNNRVRITARLVEAAQGYNIWTEAYDREINDSPIDIMWRIFREIRTRLIDMNQPQDFLPVKRDNIEYTETFYLLYRYYKTGPFDHRRMERLKAALELADKLISIEPDPWVYYMKGSILIALSSYKDSESEKYLQDAQDAASEVENIDKGASLGIKGQIKISQNDLEAALGFYKEWIAVSPGSKNAYFGAAFTLFRQKKYDEAVEKYEAGLKIDPRPESQHFVYLAIACSHPTEKGFSNLEKAKGYLRNALAPPNQNNFLAHLYLALIYTYENQMEQARFHAEEIRRIAPFFSLRTYSPGPQEDEAITRFHKDLLKKAGIPEEGRSFMGFRNNK